MSMHPNDQVADEALVGRLVGEQFPQWSDLPIARVESTGTSNVLYRLGEDMLVRMPRVGYAAESVGKEYRWLPYLAPHLPLPVPTPLARGEPGRGYPWHWAIYGWLKGAPTTPEALADPERAAVSLGGFLAALHAVDPGGGPDAQEADLWGVSLERRDDQVRKGIRALQSRIDAPATTAAWESALAAPVHRGPPAWFHGDVMIGNLLFDEGQLSSVIDFGGAGVGDPACDLTIAWGLFSGQSRETFRRAVQVDDGTWARGRGHALAFPMMYIPYYLHSNPVGVAHAFHVLEEVLADQ